MPGFDDCPECDFRDSPECCHSLATGHRRFCVLAHVLGRADYRELIRRETLREPDAGPASVPTVSGDPAPIARDATAATLALVAACPDRGSVLPHSLQPSCGCAELTECRRGLGANPGRVTLRECMACVGP